MITVEHLTKKYGDHIAVDDISFTVEAGRVYGFLGPNGAGKTTTMNILTGCLAATDGVVTIDGHDIFEEPIEAKKQIGYLPEIPPVYLDSTVAEYLAFVAEAKRVPKSGIASEVERVMDITGVTVFRDRLIRHLSKGYRQRVGIAQALAGDPKVIILDEPTVGLDPMQIIEIRQMIASLGKTHTVILSSHILSEVQEVCDTIIIISKGKLVACDTPENLERMYTGNSLLRIVLEGDPEKRARFAETIPEEYRPVVKEEPDGVTSVETECPKEERRPFSRELSRRAVEMGLTILELSSSQATLEDVFIELTKEKDPAEIPVSPEEDPGPAAEEQLPETERAEWPVEAGETPLKADEGKEGNDVRDL